MAYDHGSLAEVALLNFRSRCEGISSLDLTSPCNDISDWSITNGETLSMARYAVKEAETFKDEIAKAALRLVADRGADNVTTSDVVKTMGITRAAMARHCPSEDDLWLSIAALIERRMRLGWSAVAAGEPSPSARLRSLLAVQVGLIMGMPALRALLLSGGLHADNTALRRGLCDVRLAFKALLIEVLTEGQRAGQFRAGLEPDVTAERIMETIQGMVVSWSLDQQTGDPVEEVWARLDAFLHGTADQPQAGPLEHDQCGLS